MAKLGPAPSIGHRAEKEGVLHLHPEERAHQRHLSQKLGRDVGPVVAAADYRLNVSRTLKRPMLLEASEYRALRRAADRDPLTGLLNVSSFLRRLREECDRTKRDRGAMSLLMLDVDEFKSYNDTYGHPAGNRALLQLTQVLRQQVRPFDVAGRYGGEEFAVILVGANKREGLAVAERLRTSAGGLPLRRPITVSGGLATFPMDGTSPRQLLTFADHALYLAKKGGKNRIARVDRERRRHHRVPMVLAVRGLPHGAHGHTKDVSLGGMTLVTSRPLPVDGPWEGELELTGGRTWAFEGTVIRQHRASGDHAYEIGVRFKDPRTSLEMLQPYLQHPASGA